MDLFISIKADPTEEKGRLIYFAVASFQRTPHFKMESGIQKSKQEVMKVIPLWKTGRKFTQSINSSQDIGVFTKIITPQFYLRPINCQFKLGPIWSCIAHLWTQECIMLTCLYDIMPLCLEMAFIIWSWYFPYFSSKTYCGAH